MKSQAKFQDKIVDLDDCQCVCCYEIVCRMPVDVDNDTFLYRITIPFLAKDDEQAVELAKAYMTHAQQKGMEWHDYEVFNLYITPLTDIASQRNGNVLYASWK